MEEIELTEDGSLDDEWLTYGLNEWDEYALEAAVRIAEDGDDVEVVVASIGPERVEETIEGTSFSSTSDLVRFLLRSIVVEHQRSGELTEAQFAEIAEQLQDLGYLE